MTHPTIGLYGLGTMGAALSLNMADNGIQVHVANRTASAVLRFMEGAGPLAEKIVGHQNLEGLISALPQPRLLVAMIPSTAPMDSFLDDVIPQLAPGDTVIDAGNADFHSTRRRSERLAQHDLHFVGLGVSGGEEGARNGPSMMMGGSEASWSGLKQILTRIAATHEGDPCVDRCGPDGAGHFVKTVHNGIEYADMQMIAEVYDLLRFGAGRDVREVSGILKSWNEGRLESYLMEISGEVLSYADAPTNLPFIDLIMDRAGQKGTGRWTVIEAVKLGQSATMIEAAVAARAWSAEKPLRGMAEETFGADRADLDLDVGLLERAMLAARVLEYAQGFRILAAASEEYAWNLDPKRIAEIWRAGCIIRARLLDDIAGAFADGPPEGQLFLAPRFGGVLMEGIPALREVVTRAGQAGYATPVLSAALTFWDVMRQGRGTASLIQAQRDFFGRHGFERTDQEGDFHGPWWT
ncbi:NADP-dependent phosphogluconate dehydrogenase [Pacificoceanicola onchidii]|uniref:NADP-dependent phosphogluconate dehydrogenase n=1 Tax=Pacificoceanicola onchidii TaxID=2562685 RepID=UPI0010A37F0A|nr:NADP-dependent phosphogluconate dehydrogenase [Pacificoceanicola onchidii]